MDEKVISRLKDIKRTIDHLGASVSGTIISLQSVTSVQSGQESLEMLLERCCLAAGVTVKDVKSTNRCSEFSIVRKVYCLLAGQACSHTVAEIGRFINKSHATVLYHIKTARQLLEVNDKVIVSILNKLK